MGPILQSIIESLLPQPIVEEIVPHIFDYDELKCGLRFINIRSSFQVKIPHLFVEIVEASITEASQFRILYGAENWKIVNLERKNIWKIKLYPGAEICVSPWRVVYEQIIETSLTRDLIFRVEFWFDQRLYPKPYYTACFGLRGYSTEIHYRETFDQNGYSIMDVSDDMDAEEFMERSWFYRYFE